MTAYDVFSFMDCTFLIASSNSLSNSAWVLSGITKPHLSPHEQISFSSAARSNSGKTFSGHIAGFLGSGGPGTTSVVICILPSDQIIISRVFSSGESAQGPFNASFACDKIVFRSVDIGDGTNDPAVGLTFVIQYDESSDVTTLT